MNLNDVCFVGGSEGLSSVKIRCVEIANRLGCKYICDVRSFKQIPVGYKAYFLVKAVLSEEEVFELSKNAHVIWDVIDHFPPEIPSIHTLLVSTKMSGAIFSKKYRTHVIPHHHCNIGRTTNVDSQRIVWIGNPRWRPVLTGIDCTYVDNPRMTRDEVEIAFRTMGIGLNLRADLPNVEIHLALNSGIKLINCIGFGVPSISALEPAYCEIDAGCTAFATNADFCVVLDKVKNDIEFRMFLKRNCIATADQYHLDVIAGKYASFLGKL